MVSLSTISCLLQVSSGSIKGHLQVGLMLLDPLMNGAILNSAQEKVHWEPWFLAEHKEEGQLSSALMGSGVVTVRNLRQT